MATVVVPDPRPYRCELYFLFNADECRQTLDLLRRASDHPGRVRRLPLVRSANPAYKPEWCREALAIVADKTAVHPVALSNLRGQALQVAIRPGEDTKFHAALRDVIDGEWDFSLSLPVLDPVEMPKMAIITATFL